MGKTYAAEKLRKRELAQRFFPTYNEITLLLETSNRTKEQLVLQQLVAEDCS